MKLSKFKRLISGTVSAVMIASSIPAVASAADQQTRGNIGGYDYEMWNQNGQGQVSMQPGAGSFTCSWSNIENFLARMGKNYDSQGKNYKQIGDIVLTYDVEYTPRGNSYMCVYGWTKSPLVEYYIVEGWGDWRPPGNDGENKGTVTLNGNTYDIRKSMRYNQPSLEGTSTFPQYWSVRQTSGSANNQTNYMKGTIDVSKHFDAWSKAGLDMSGSLYEVSLNIEGYRSNGSANVKSVTVSTDGSGGGASNTAPANNTQQPQNNDWNNQWNNQQPQQQNANVPDAGTAMNSSASMADDFRNGSSKYFIASDGWENGAPFDCGWYASQTGFSNGALNLTIDKDNSGKYNYKGAEYRTNDFYHYGYYETSMQAIKNKGVVSSFFTYTGESDGNPWDEIDIEILGKDTTKVQFNYYTNGQGKHEKMYDLGFDASQGFHTYGFDWQPDHITWYVDGKEAYTAKQDIPKTAGKIMMNAWPGKGVDEWLDHYDGRTPLTARYQWVTYDKNGKGGSGNAQQQNTQPQQNNDWNNQWNNQQQNNDWNNQWNNQQQNNDWNNQWNNQQQNNDWNNQWNNQQQNNDWNNQWNNQQQNNDWNNQWNNQQQNNDWNNQQQNNQWNNNWSDWSNGWNNGWNFDWNNFVSKWGDANRDNSVDMADTITIMQSLANPDKYNLENQGMFNADVYQPGGGITNNDAVSVQKYLLGSITNLPDGNWGNQQQQQNNWNQNVAQQNNDWNNQWNNQQPQQNNDWNNQWNNQQSQQQNNSAPVGGGQTFSVGNGKTQHKGDNVDGYSYEIWLDNTGGSGSMTLGSGGSFSTEWSAQVSAGNFLARRGRNYDASKKATQYGPIVMDYAADYSASSQGNSRLCVYGWMKDPLVEYYIIEDWVNWCPSANGQSKTVTIDGAEYEIFQLDHTGPTILGDTRTFKQYFSVRKSKRTSGTITVSDHFKAWENAGWNIGNLTEVALNVEGWESSGKANVTKLTIGESSSGSNSNTQQPQQQNNDWNNQWNNQQQNNNAQQPAQNNVQVNGNKKLCAISFDDGASATSKTDSGYRIIDALIKNNMTATFFNVGDWIKTNDQIKYEYQNGMEVANHTKSHPHLGQLGSSQIRSEWEQCNSKLKSIIGAEPSHLMRLPYLESNATVQSALNDVPLISCAIDTQDWNGASKDQIVNTIKQAAQNGSLEGAIVLCHETYATTAAAMEEVLPWLAQNGYQNVNISDMAKAHGKTLSGGQVYTRA